MSEIDSGISTSSSLSIANRFQITPQQRDWWVAACNCNFPVMIKLLSEDRELVMWRSALHYAAKWNQTTIIKLLINDYKADVNIQNYGRTPLHLAAESARKETILLLTSTFQADTLIRDHHGFLARDLLPAPPPPPPSISSATNQSSAPSMLSLSKGEAIAHPLSKYFKDPLKIKAASSDVPVTLLSEYVSPRESAVPITPSPTSSGGGLFRRKRTNQSLLASLLPGSSTRSRSPDLPPPSTKDSRRRRPKFDRGHGDRRFSLLLSSAGAEKRLTGLQQQMMQQQQLIQLKKDKDAGDQLIKSIHELVAKYHANDSTASAGSILNDTADETTTDKVSSNDQATNPSEE